MSQSQRLLTLLSDGLPHRTDEIVEKVYGHGLSLSRVGARVFDLKKKYKLEISGWHDPVDRTLYWYQLKAAVASVPDFTPTMPRQTEGVGIPARRLAGTSNPASRQNLLFEIPQEKRYTTPWD